MPVASAAFKKPLVCVLVHSPAVRCHQLGAASRASHSVSTPAAATTTPSRWSGGQCTTRVCCWLLLTKPVLVVLGSCYSSSVHGTQVQSGKRPPLMPTCSMHRAVMSCSGVLPLAPDVVNCCLPEGMPYSLLGPALCCCSKQGSMFSLSAWWLLGAGAFGSTAPPSAFCSIVVCCCLRPPCQLARAQY